MNHRTSTPRRTAASRARPKVLGNIVFALSAAFVVFGLSGVPMPGGGKGGSPEPAPLPAPLPANPAPPPPPPPGVGCNRGFVRLLYQDVLGRPVDAAGEAYWVGALDGGLPALSFIQGVLGSSEAKTLIVRDAYLTYLQREPDPAGISFGTSVLTTYGYTETMYRAIILSSAEYFYGRGGSDTLTWLTVLYGDVLGRPLDPTGQATWLQALAQGMTRTQVATAILSSPEYQTLVVADMVQRFLQRPADPMLSTGLLGLFQVSGSHDAVAEVILASAEYYNRSGGTAGCEFLMAQTSGGGAGDLVLTGVPSSVISTAVEGWLLVSFSTSQAVGSGALLGIEPDEFTNAVINLPGATGGLFHWLNSPSHFPNQQVVMAPGTLSFLAGLTVDLLQVDVDATPAIANVSNIVRITF